MKNLAPLALIALAACSGGGSSTGTSVPRALATPAAPAVMPSATLATGQAATVSLTLTIPGHAATANVARRRPQFVDAASVLLTFQQNGGTVQNIPIAPGSPNCTTDGSGNRTCTVQAPATSGPSQSFTFKTYANATGSGTPLSVATVVQTVVAGQANPLAVTLSGVVTGLTVALARPSLPYGQPGSTTVALNATDAAGHVIVGPGSYVDANGNPVTIALADSDASGATTLSAASATGPGTPVTLSYGGSAIATTTLTASATGVPNATAVATFDCPATPGTSAVFLAGSQYTAATKTNIAFIDRLPAAASGTAANVLSGLTLPSRFFNSLAVDNRGFAYTIGQVPGANTSAIVGYCPNATGTPPPYLAIVAPQPLPSDFAGFAYVATDPARDVYTVERMSSGAQLSVYGPATFGNPTGTSTATPALRQYSGAATSLTTDFPVGLAADGAGTAYMATSTAFSTGTDMLSSAVLEFPAATQGNVAPQTILRNTAGGLIDAIDVALDANGNVYVLYQHDNRVAQNDLGPYAIAEFAAGSPLVPIRVISGPATHLGTYQGATYTTSGGFTAYHAARKLTVGSDGTIYVANVADQPTSATSSTARVDVDAFSTTAGSENVAPTKSISVCCIVLPNALAVDGNGNVYAGDAGTSAGVVEYSASGEFLKQYAFGSSGIGLTEGIAIEPGSGNVTIDSLDFISTTNQHVGTKGIFTFTQEQSGSSAPTRTLTPPANDFSNGIGYDKNGNLFTAETYGVVGTTFVTPQSQVEVFAPGASGAQSPTRSFTDSSALYAQGYFTGFGSDPNGDVVEADFGLQAAHTYAPGASGSVTASGIYRAIGPSTLEPSVYVDAGGTAFVASCATDSISAYAPGTTTPVRTIFGLATGLVCPGALTGDGTTLYALNYDDGVVREYPIGANGNQAPTGTIGVPSNAFLDSLAFGPGTPTDTTAAATSIARRASESLGSAPPASRRSLYRAQQRPECGFAERGSVVIAVGGTTAAARATTTPADCEIVRKVSSAMRRR